MKSNDDNYVKIEKICILVIVCLFLLFCVFCFLGMEFISRIILGIAFVLLIFARIILNKSERIKLFFSAIFRFMIITILLVIACNIAVQSLFDEIFRGCY